MSKTSLFLGDLAIFCEEHDIREVFSPFGEIIEIKVMRNTETYQHMSYGFLTFLDPLSAKCAMTDMNGYILCGRPLRIRWASHRTSNGSKSIDTHSDSPVNVPSIHCTFISYQVDFMVTEASLRDLFSQYGTVMDVAIKKSTIHKEIPRQSGYGFIHFSTYPEGITSALEAVKYLNDATISNVHYKSSISHNLNKLLMNNDDSVGSMLDQSREDNKLLLYDETNSNEYRGGDIGSMMAAAAAQLSQCTTSYHLPTRTLSPPLLMHNNSHEIIYKFPPCSLAHNCWNCQDTSCQARSLPIPTDRRHVIYIGSHDALPQQYYPNHHSLTTAHVCFKEPSINPSTWNLHPNTYYRHINDSHNVAYGHPIPTTHSPPVTSIVHQPYYPPPYHFKVGDQLIKNKVDSNNVNGASTIELTKTGGADNNNNNNINYQGNNNNNNNNNNNHEVLYSGTKKFKGNKDNSFHS